MARIEDIISGNGGGRPIPLGIPTPAALPPSVKSTTFLQHSCGLAAASQIVPDLQVKNFEDGFPDDPPTLVFFTSEGRYAFVLDKGQKEALVEALTGGIVVPG